MPNEVADYALPLPRVLQLCEELARVPADDGRQIIVDMPYRYTWEPLRNGSVPAGGLSEDRFEAIHYRAPGSGLIIKMNPFPFSFRRALKVTHDGEVILIMDLAAHPDYRHSSLPFAELDGGHLFPPKAVCKAHSGRARPSPLRDHGTLVFERELEQQLAAHRGLAAVA